MTAAEAEKRIQEILETGQFKEFGPAMKAVMGKLRGKADSKIIGEIVKKILGL